MTVSLKNIKTKEKMNKIKEILKDEIAAYEQWKSDPIYSDPGFLKDASWTLLYNMKPEKAVELFEELIK